MTPARLLCTWMVLPLLACSSLDQFDVPLKASGTLQGSFSQLGGFPTWPAGDSVSKEIENQGAKPGDITSARLTSGRLTVTAPEGGSLGKYVENLEIFISAPGLDEKRIAHRASFENAVSPYDFTLDDLDLKAYATASSMKLRPALTQKAKPAQDYQLEIDLVLHVDLAIID